MSVLIRGMSEIPEDGAVLVVKHDDNGKAYIKYAYTYGYSMELVEISKPHGRLIDADELWNKMSIYTDNEGAKFPFGDDDSMIHRDSACFVIENATPVIEAEGENGK